MSADFCRIENQSMGEKCRFQEKPEIAPVALKSLAIGHESFLLDIAATVLLSLPDFVYRSCQAIVAMGLREAEMVAQRHEGAPGTPREVWH
jgi:hypothetical protein